MSSYGVRRWVRLAVRELMPVCDGTGWTSVDGGYRNEGCAGCRLCEPRDWPYVFVILLALAFFVGVAVRGLW